MTEKEKELFITSEFSASNSKNIVNEVTAHAVFLLRNPSKAPTRLKIIVHHSSSESDSPIRGLLLLCGKTNKLIHSPR